MADAHELETRHLTVNGKATTIRVERIFWVVVENIATQAGIPCNEFINRILSKKPATCDSRAAWIRVFVACALRKRVRELQKA